eukprot:6213710-Pleurochrysis_carterae.AAC.1
MSDDCRRLRILSGTEVQTYAHERAHHLLLIGSVSDAIYYEYIRLCATLSMQNGFTRDTKTDSGVLDRQSITDLVVWEPVSCLRGLSLASNRSL